MKFSTDSLALYKALETVSGALPTKPDKEILACIFLQRKGNFLELLAADLEIFIRHRFPVHFESEPDEVLDMVAVPAQQFLESCKTLPETPITFEVKPSHRITLSHDLGEYNWMGFNANSFPTLPEIEDAQSIKFNRNRLKSGFLSVAFTAAINDLSRPGMNGILFEVLDGSARFVATNGHRLSRFIFKDYEGVLDVRVLAQPKLFQQVIRIEGPSECTILIGENHVSFEFGNTHLIGTLINAPFPDYERAIPNENDKLVTVGRHELLNSVHRANFFASLSSNQIILECRENQILVTAKDTERSSDGREEVSCIYNGEPTGIGFNAQLLRELIKNLPSDKITLSMGTPNRAALLKPEPQNEMEDLTFLLMPVMLNKLS